MIEKKTYYDFTYQTTVENALVYKTFLFVDKKTCFSPPPLQVTEIASCLAVIGNSN